MIFHKTMRIFHHFIVNHLNLQSFVDFVIVVVVLMLMMLIEVVKVKCLCMHCENFDFIND